MVKSGTRNALLLTIFRHKMYKEFTKMDRHDLGLFTNDLDFKGTRGHTLKFEKTRIYTGTLVSMP